MSSVFVPVAVLLGGLALAGYGGLQLRPVYHILQNDPVDVADLEHRSGPVEVVGTAVREEDTVVAPFSGRECLLFRYKVEELRQSGKHSHWETLDEGEAGVPFLVDDGTGRVPVDPDGADIPLETHETRVDSGEEPPERIARYVEETDAVDANDQSVDLRLIELAVGNDQRFTERRLDVGENVYVYGSVDRPAVAPDWGSDRVDAELGAGSGPAFVVSDSSERGTAWRLARRPLVIAGFGVLVTILMLFVVASSV